MSPHHSVRCLSAARPQPLAEDAGKSPPEFLLLFLSAFISGPFLCCSSAGNADESGDHLPDPIPAPLCGHRFFRSPFPLHINHLPSRIADSSDPACYTWNRMEPRSAVSPSLPAPANRPHPANRRKIPNQPILRPKPKKPGRLLSPKRTHRRVRAAPRSPASPEARSAKSSVLL